MKSTHDVTKARHTVARELRRVDIGNTHQRAMLVGLLTALQWVEEIGVLDKNTLQQLIDGRKILPNSETIHEAFARQQAEDAQKSRRNQTLIMAPGTD